MADEFCLKMPDFHVTFRDLLHAVNIWHGTNGFISLPKEGVLRFSSPLVPKFAGLNPWTLVPKASTLPLDHRSRLKMIIMLNVLCAPHILVFLTEAKMTLKNAHKSSKTQKKVSSCFTSNGSIEHEKVTAAEASFVFHSVKHSHSYVSVDCCSNLFPQLFPDSKICEKYSCGRTKATKLISSVLGPYSKERTIRQLNVSVYYSSSSDASKKRAHKNISTRSA